MVKHLPSKKFEVQTSASLSSCQLLSPELLLPQTLTSLIDSLPKNHSSYRQKSKNIISCKKWSVLETDKFYELLRLYGLDFTIMSFHGYFKGKRSHKELANKYKKESKLRAKRVDQILDEIQTNPMFGICSRNPQQNNN